MKAVARSCHISCTIDSISMVREIVGINKFLSVQDEFKIYSITAAYNAETKEASIYAEFELMCVSRIEEFMLHNFASAVKISSTAMNAMENVAGKALRRVVDFVENTPGSLLIRSAIPPKAAENPWYTSSSAEDGEESGMEEQMPQADEGMKKRRRSVSPLRSGGTNSEMISLMQTMYDDVNKLREQVDLLTTENKVLQGKNIMMFRNAVDADGHGWQSRFKEMELKLKKSEAEREKLQSKLSRLESVLGER